MDTYIEEIFANGALILLTGLFTGFLFFFVTAMKEFKDEHPDGLLYFTFSVFFFVGHLYCLFNQPENSYIGRLLASISIWSWAVMIAAPSLILLLLLAAFINAVSRSIKLGLYKGFFGMTLVCFLYMIGQTWPVDIKALLTLLWAGVWFHLELGDVA